MGSKATESMLLGSQRAPQAGAQRVASPRLLLPPQSTPQLPLLYFTAGARLSHSTFWESLGLQLTDGPAEGNAELTVTQQRLVWETTISVATLAKGPDKTLSRLANR